jgi:hypothetical protein
MARHPLQRLASPSRNVSLLIHALGLSCFIAQFGWLDQWDHPFRRSFGGYYQFLTNLGLVLATITVVVGLLADLTLNPRLFAAKNALSVCSTPLEVLISMMYWGIRCIDESLLFPPEFKIPLLPDVGLHLMPAVVLTTDLLLLSPPWTVTGYAAMSISMSLAFLYWGWVEYCFSKNGW